MSKVFYECNQCVVVFKEPNEGRCPECYSDDWRKIELLTKKEKAALPPIQKGYIHRTAKVGPATVYYNRLTTDETEIIELKATLRNGHLVNFFLNLKSSLCVVDVVHKNEKGGNEIMRKDLSKVNLWHAEEEE